MKKVKVTKEDYQRYYIPQGDAGFSAERNNFLIEDTIKKTDAKIAQNKKVFKEKLEYRTDAVASFLKAVDKGKYQSGSSQEKLIKYFGKKELTKLRGQEIAEKIKRSMGGL